MSDDGGQGDEEQVFFIGADGRRMTMADLQREQALAAAEMEAFGQSIRRLLFVELDEDQLDTLRQLFRRLGAHKNPARIVNWYEGLIDGAAYSRRLLAEESDLTAFMPMTADAHQYDPDPEGRCRFSIAMETGGTLTCGLPEPAKPHRAWAEQQ